MNIFSYHIAFIQRIEMFSLNETFIIRIKRIIEFWKLKGLL